VKLAQLQLLFAELDNIAYKSRGRDSNTYYPTILTGDLNLTPSDSIYGWITSGELQYKGLGRELTSSFRGQALDNVLISPLLKVTDQCQHLHINEQRRLLLKKTKVSGDVENEITSESTSRSFSSGRLSHNFKFQSVYSHFNRFNEPEVTAYQNRFVTVDYIFHNGSETVSPSLRLLSRLKLLTSKEVEDCGHLPSLSSPSDHLPLAATFLLESDS